MNNNLIGDKQYIYRQIKYLLLNEWDPIGVKEFPEGDDEYDMYIPNLYRMVISGKHASEIYKYLIWVESDHIGLPADRQLTMSISEKLSALGEIRERHTD
jgi:hypothetical protein